jgi:hypothetical protein
MKFYKTFLVFYFIAILTFPSIAMAGTSHTTGLITVGANRRSTAQTDRRTHGRIIGTNSNAAGNRASWHALFVCNIRGPLHNGVLSQQSWSLSRGQVRTGAWFHGGLLSWNLFDRTIHFRGTVSVNANTGTTIARTTVEAQNR